MKLYGAILTVITLVLGAFAAIALSATVADDDGALPLTATANGQHIWLLGLNDGPEGGSIIRHIDPARSELTYSEHTRITRPIEAMIAAGDRLLLVFPATRGSGRGREVMSLSISYNEPLDAYVASPQRRLRVETSLPADGLIASTTDHPDGPIVLLVDAAAQRTSPERTTRSVGDASGDGTQVDEPPIELPALLQMRGSRWRRIELPTQVVDALGRNPRIVTSGSEGSELVLLPQTSPNVGSQLWMRDAKRSWSRTQLDTPIDAVRDVARAGEITILVQSVTSRGDDAQPEVALSSLRPGGAVEMARVARPAERWRIVGTDHGIFIVSDPTGPTHVRLQRIDALSGQLEPAIEPTLHRARQMQVWLTLSIIAIAVGGLLMFAIMRPMSGRSAPEIDPARLAPLSLRALALLIDAVPAVIATMLILDVQFVEVVRAPVIQVDLFSAAPYMLAAGLMITHAAIFELLLGRSLGKMLLALDVSSISGAEPRWFEILLRNFGKLISLAVPPLVLIVLLNPAQQSMGDFLARTLVVRHGGHATRLSDEDADGPTDRPR